MVAINGAKEINGLNLGVRAAQKHCSGLGCTIVGLHRLSCGALKGVSLKFNRQILEERTRLGNDAIGTASGIWE